MAIVTANINDFIYAPISPDDLMEFFSISLNQNKRTNVSDIGNALGVSIVAPNELEDAIARQNNPGTETLGFRYVVGAAPTGVWAGFANQVAEWDGLQWIYQMPASGDVIQLSSTQQALRFDGTNWNAYPGISIRHNGQAIGSRPIKIGTTNAQDLLFKTNNVDRVRLESGGILGYTSDVSGALGDPFDIPSINWIQGYFADNSLGTGQGLTENAGLIDFGGNVDVLSALQGTGLNTGVQWGFAPASAGDTHYRLNSGFSEGMSTTEYLLKTTAYSTALYLSPTYSELYNDQALLMYNNSNSQVFLDGNQVFIDGGGANGILMNGATSWRIGHPTPAVGASIQSTNGAGTFFRDDIYSAGIQYNSPPTNMQPLSLVYQQQMIDYVAANGGLGAGNGLTENAGNIDLGGTLPVYTVLEFPTGGFSGLDIARDDYQVFFSMDVDGGTPFLMQAGASSFSLSNTGGAVFSKGRVQGAWEFQGSVTVPSALAAAPTIAAPAAATQYWGNENGRLGTPDAWEDVIQGGVLYKKPLYLP